MQMLRKHPAAAHKSSVVMDEGWILVYKGAMAMGCQTEGDQVCCELFMRGQCAWIATEASGSGSSEAVSGGLGMGKGNSLALSSSCRSERKKTKQGSRSSSGRLERGALQVTTHYLAMNCAGCSCRKGRTFGRPALVISRAPAARMTRPPSQSSTLPASESCAASVVSLRDAAISPPQE